MVASRLTQIALLGSYMPRLLPSRPFRDDESRVIVDLQRARPDAGAVQERYVPGQSSAFCWAGLQG